MIENGADDTIENNLGLTPYDGLGLKENKMIAASGIAVNEILKWIGIDP